MGFRVRSFYIDILCSECGGCIGQDDNTAANLIKYDVFYCTECQPKPLKTKPCNKCKKDIGFIMSKTGNYIPVDPQLLTLSLNISPLTPVVNRAGVTDLLGKLKEGFTNHFNTCNKPNPNN